jgi:hypothetical protein
MIFFLKIHKNSSYFSFALIPWWWLLTTNRPKSDDDDDGLQSCCWVASIFQDYKKL